MKDNIDERIRAEYREGSLELREALKRIYGKEFFDEKEPEDKYPPTWPQMPVKDYSDEELEEIAERCRAAAAWMEENDTNFMLNGLGSQGFKESPPGFTREIFESFVEKEFPESVGSLILRWSFTPEYEKKLREGQYWLDFGLGNHDTYRKFLNIRASFLRHYADNIAYYARPH